MCIRIADDKRSLVHPFDYCIHINILRDAIANNFLRYLYIILSKNLLIYITLVVLVGNILYYIDYCTFRILGVKEKVDYIKDLGVDSVWLSPFYKNGMDDLEKCPNSTNCDEDFQNYDWSDVLDHKSVGERFGSEADLDDLFDEMEKNGRFLFEAFSSMSIILLNS